MITSLITFTDQNSLRHDEPLVVLGRCSEDGERDSLLMNCDMFEQINEVEQAEGAAFAERVRRPVGWGAVQGKNFLDPWDEGLPKAADVADIFFVVGRDADVAIFIINDDQLPRERRSTVLDQASSMCWSKMVPTFLMRMKLMQ